ncbi:MAG: hypothetical protein AAF170_16570 [Bacteroidota bacterium]
MNRLYDAPAVIFDTKAEDVTGAVTTAPIRVTLDLERVIMARDDPDDSSRCIVELTGECVTLAQSKDVFTANWEAYRRSADVLWQPPKKQ